MSRTETTPEQRFERFFVSCCEALGAKDSEAIDSGWLALVAMYNHPVRAYHNLDHIAECVEVFMESAARNAPVETVALVGFSLYWHDCVYDSRRDDNEARSAAVAVTMARAMGIEFWAHGTIRRLIQATTHRGTPGDESEALIRDVDLASLAARATKFDANTAAIRSEYAWASDEQWRAGRVAFFKEVLARPAIYFTPSLHQRWEAPARQNLQRGLAAMGAVRLPDKAG